MTNREDSQDINELERLANEALANQGRDSANLSGASSSAEAEDKKRKEAEAQLGALLSVAKRFKNSGDIEQLYTLLGHLNNFAATAGYSSGTPYRDLYNEAAEAYREIKDV